MGHATHKCLLDRGCDYLLIPYRLVPKAHLEPVALDVTAANGSPIKILGLTVIHFTIEGEEVSATVMVSDQIEEPMLGYDWLCNQDIIWNFNAKQVLFRNKPVRLKPRTSPVSVSRVYVREKVDIAPYSEQNVHVRLVHMNW